MRLTFLSGLLLLLLLSFGSGCAAGPHRLGRGWDDTVNNLYSQNAWLHGALLQDIIPVYPIVHIVMWLGDILILNPYYFWTNDAWDNEGTGFIHETPSGPKTVGRVM